MFVCICDYVYLECQFGLPPLSRCWTDRLFCRCWANVGPLDKITSDERLMDRVNPSAFFQHSNIRGHDQNQKFMKKRGARLGLRQSVFSQRVVNDWNSLLIEVLYRQWQSRVYCRPRPNIYGHTYWCSRNTFSARNRPEAWWPKITKTNQALCCKVPVKGLPPLPLLRHCPCPSLNSFKSRLDKFWL